MGTNPLIGPNDPRWEKRFSDMGKAYYEKILAALESFGLKSGIYAAFTGPSAGINPGNIITEHEVIELYV